MTYLILDRLTRDAAIIKARANHRITSPATSADRLDTYARNGRTHRELFALYSDDSDNED